MQVAAASDERKLYIRLSQVVHENVVGGRGYFEGVAPQVADLFLILRLAAPQEVLDVLQLASLELDHMVLCPVLLQKGHLELLLNLSGFERVDQRRAEPCFARHFVLFYHCLHIGPGWWWTTRRIGKKVGAI